MPLGVISMRLYFPFCCREMYPSFSNLDNIPLFSLARAKEIDKNAFATEKPRFRLGLPRKRMLLQ